MTALLNSLGAITLFVEDPQRSKSFYEDVFGVSVLFEDEDSAAFEFDNTILNVLRASEAHDLIAPGTVAGADAGSSFQLTIWVDDRGSGMRATEGKGRDAAERPDGSGMGSTYRQLHRSGRPHLGARPAAPLAGGSRSAH